MTDSYKISDTVRIFMNDENSYFVGTVKKFEDEIVTLFIATDELTFTFDDDESVVLKFDEDAARYYWSVHISKLKEIEDSSKYC